MESRMGKYNDESIETMSRYKRNSNIYSSTDMSNLEDIKTNNNVSIISDSHKEINLEKIKAFIENNNSNNKKERVILEDYKEDNVLFEKKEQKDYDINTVLERARKQYNTDYSTNKYKSVDSDEYKIINSIKIPEENPNINDLNTEEKTIVNFINEISNKESKEDLFSNLMGSNENTVVLGAKETKESLEEISEKIDEIKKPLDDLTKDLIIESKKLKELVDSEKKDDGIKVSKIEADESFYTDSMSFDEKDFEELDESSSSLFSKIATILIIIILIGILVLLANYVFDLDLF